LVMDDNHFLIEWLAYHYFVLPLRHVIVIVDPKSETSPTRIFDRWRDRMTIEVWEESRFIPRDFETLAWQEVGTSIGVKRHRARQKAFYRECMKELKRNDKGWVLFTDTDEFTLVNPYQGNPESKIYDANTYVPSIEEPGSVLKLLQQFLLPVDRFHMSAPCAVIYRKPFSSRESASDEVQNMFPDNFGMNASHLSTFRWRHWGFYIPEVAGQCYERRQPGKALVDLARIRLTDLDNPQNSGNPHK